MTDFLRENIDQIKTIVVKTKGTPTQKLLAILMLAGIEKTADLAAMTGLSERAVQTAKRNLLRETDCVTQPIAAQPIAETQPVAGQSAIHCAPTKKVSPTPPSKKDNHLEQSVQQVAARDDGRTDDVAECKAAFNGSTEAMLAMVESAMGGHCRANAAQWLANLTRINGQQAVAQAFQKFLTAKAEGQIIARPLPWFDKTARTCKAEAPKAAPAAADPISAITQGMVRYAKPAPGSVRLPEVAGRA